MEFFVFWCVRLKRFSMSDLPNLQYNCGEAGRLEIPEGVQEVSIFSNDSLLTNVFAQK